MMADNLPRSWIQRVYVVNQLVSVRVAAEPVDGDHIAPDVDHQSLPSVHEGDLCMALL